MRVRKRIDDAPVWVRDDTGDWRPARADIPAGWYALPDPGPAPEPRDPSHPDVP